VPIIYMPVIMIFSKIEF